METQKIVNLLNGTDNESSKFATRKWHIISDQNNTEYGKADENGLTSKFGTKIIKPFLCDYEDAYILVTRDIRAAAGNASSKVAFNNCASFTRCVTQINDEHVETAENLDIIMNMYNLIEYSHNYADSSGSLWKYKRDDQNMNNGNPANVTTNNSSYFKYKSRRTVVAGAGILKNATIPIPQKYLSNFFRSIELPLINYKINLELNWTKDCVMSDIGGDTTFQIKSKKLYVPIVTLSSKDNVNLTKQLSDGFKRSVYWNKYKPKIELKNADNDNLTRFNLDTFSQGVERLFVLVFNNTTKSDAENPIKNR